MTVRCQDVFFAMAIGRCETWLPIFCTIPTRPTCGCLQLYIFLGDGKCCEQVMIGNRDELKGNQDLDARRVGCVRKLGKLGRDLGTC